MMCRIPFKPCESMVNYLDMYLSRDSFDSQRTDDSSEPTEDNKPSINSLEDKNLGHDQTEDQHDTKWMFDARIVSGTWDLHRFDNHPWSTKVRPFRRIKHFENLKLNEKEKAGKLTKRMIGCCLTYLERSPYDLRYALCKCQLAEKAIEDISVLQTYHYIQYLDLSHNKITSLAALSEMPFLQYLDVSGNYIENAFDFKAPLYLTTVNYSNNKITRMPNMADYWSITSLDMSFNCIREIKGVNSLKYLLHLNLSYNKIRMVENLSKLRLLTLNLSHNQISLFENEIEDNGFNTLLYLTTIDFSYNKLTRLYFLQGNESLEDINVSNNELINSLEIYYLRNMLNLKRLNISNNLLCSRHHFRALCLRILPKLREFNGETITAEARVEVLTKEDYSPLIPAHITRMQLLLLEHLNRPKIGAHVCRYGEPAPCLLVVVGPPAARKKDICTKFVEHSEFLKLGLSYTTRPKRTSDVDSNEYIFTSYNNFVQMIRRAEFLTVTEFNGHLYGIALKELEKAVNCILVFFSDLETALILKMAGLNPKLVLAMPRDEKVHIDWIKDTYFFDENDTTALPEIMIKQVPTTIKHSVDNMDTDSFFSDYGDDRSFEIGDISSMSVADSSKDELRKVDSSIRSFQFNESRSDRSVKMVEDFDSAGISLLSAAKKEQATETATQAMEITVSENYSMVIAEPHKQILKWTNYEDVDEHPELSQEPQELANDAESAISSFNEELKKEDQKESATKVASEENKCSKEDLTCQGILKKDLQDPEHELSSQIDDMSHLECKRRSMSWSTMDPDIAVESISNAGPSDSQSETCSVQITEGSVRKFTQEECRDRANSSKRVSFNYKRSSGGDDSSYDASFFELSNRAHIKSVSNTHILRSMQNRFFDNPLLSVLSATKLNEQEEQEKGKVNTAYTTLAERFDNLKTDKLGPFLNFCMSLRKELLELHFENPGLFQTIIFTDENVKDCINALKDITKNIVETHHLVEKTDEIDNESEYQEAIERKLEKLKVYENRFSHVEYYK